MTSDPARRIALLARPGVACERLREVLQDVSSELVLEADPTEIDLVGLQAATPQSVVVLLDSAVEDRLEDFDAVLSDPGIDVLYEEAELVAAREGWDLARWRRHLSAKLLRHDDVSPPRPAVDADVAGASAQVDAASGLEVDSDRGEAAIAQAPEVAAELAPEAALVTDAAPEDTAPEAAEDASSAGPVTVDPAPEAPVSPTDGGTSDFDPVNAEYTPQDTLSVIPEPPAGQVQSDTPTPAVDAEPDSATEQQDMPAADFDPALLDQPGDDTRSSAQAPAPQVSTKGKRVHDLEELDRRIANLALVETAEAEAEEAENDADDVSGLEKEAAPAAAETGSTDAGSTETAHGALLVLAGIGGPDAVRQLLSGLPVDFPRPVLVQQRLDGGRHDRLVQQMSRATELPVCLACDGDAVEAGHVYILPPDVSVAADASGLRFVEADTDLVAVLPAEGSAILMLSGSDAGLVDAAMAQAGQGTLVAGQSPEGCYDSDAAAALIARGAESGQPAELASRLVKHWMH